MESTGIASSGTSIVIWILEFDEAAHDPRTFRPDLKALLTQNERARADRFIDKPAALRFLFGRSLLRCALSAHSKSRAILPAAWRFDQQEHGKPELTAPFANTQLKFNLSHSAGMIVCAVTNQLEVGIDVEHLERDIDVVSVGTYCLSPHEIANIQATLPAERQRRFLQYWTLKEAYAKTRGDGLSYPLKRVTMGMRSDGRVSLLDENDVNAAQDFRFVQIVPTSQFVGALCWKQAGSNEVRVRIRSITEADLVAIVCSGTKSFLLG